MIGGSDIASDFDIFDGVETVAITCRNSNGTTTSNTGVTALRRPLDRQEASLAGVFSSGDSVVFIIQNSDLTSTEIREGDTVTSLTGGTNTWKVISVQHNTWRTKWRLVCNRNRS